MSDGRLVVRATAEFFQDLDRQLPAERGPNGSRSTYDFQAFELLRIVERFAIGFLDLPDLMPGGPDYRILIGAGTLVAGFAVVGQMAAHGAVELVQLALDVGGAWPSAERSPSGPAGIPDVSVRLVSICPPGVDVSQSMM